MTQREVVEAAKAKLRSEPTNLALAKAAWAAFQSPYDLRSVVQAVEVFGPAAMKSEEGRTELAAAVHKLFLESGELPTAQHFAPELVRVLLADRRSDESLRWLLTCLS